MYQSLQTSIDVMICYECEFRRPPDSLKNGLSDAAYMKLENDGHLKII